MFSFQPSQYCYPLSGYAEMRESTGSLKRKEQYYTVEEFVYYADLKALLLKHLETCALDSNCSYTAPDEEGRYIVFIKLKSFLKKIISETIVIAILYPEIYFNISELEAIFDFTIEEELQRRYAGEIHDRFKIYQNTIFIDVESVLFLLSTYCPSFSMLIYFTLISKDDENHTLIKEFIRSFSDNLGSIEKCCFDKLLDTTPDKGPEIYCKELLCNVDEYISIFESLVSREGNVFYSLMMKDCIKSIISDEVTKIEETFISNAEVVDDFDYESGFSAETYMDQIYKISNFSRRIRYKLACFAKIFNTLEY